MAVALTTACGAKSDSKDDDSTTEDADGGGTSASNKVGSVTTIADLKLAGALAIDLPEAFGGQAPGARLRLAGGKKSQEACFMGQTIQESVRSLDEVASFFCHLEVEKDRVKFGKKYRLMTPQGEFAKIFVDNSQAASGKLVIGFCQNRGSESGSRQLINIDALTDAGPKGTIISDGSGSEQNTAFTFARSTNFDMSVADIVSLISKDKNTQGSNTFVREVSLDLKNAGQSTLKLAVKGTNSGAEFYDRGVAYMSGDKGSSVSQKKGTYQGNTFTFASRSHFTKTGEVLGSADVGADLQPAVTAMPAYLPSTFTPDAPTGWVGSNCPDYDEEVTIDPFTGGHASCDQGQDNANQDPCRASEFEASSEVVTVD